MDVKKKKKTGWWRWWSFRLAFFLPTFYGICTFMNTYIYECMRAYWDVFSLFLVTFLAFSTKMKLLTNEKNAHLNF